MSKNHTRIRAGEVVWTLGLTVRNAGTNHTNAYYLPVKAIVGYVKENTWGRVFLVSKKNPPSKVFRGLANTTVPHYEIDKRQISRSFNKIQRLCKTYNESVRSNE